MPDHEVPRWSLTPIVALDRFPFLLHPYHCPCMRWVKSNTDSVDIWQCSLNAFHPSIQLVTEAGTTGRQAVLSSRMVRLSVVTAQAPLFIERRRGHDGG